MGALFQWMQQEGHHADERESKQRARMREVIDNGRPPKTDGDLPFFLDSLVL
jgi:hypothetical protein